MASKKVTIQTKKTVTNGSGTYKPGAIMRVSQVDAAFLIKADAAIEIKNKGGSKIEKSPEVLAAIKLAAKEKAKAEKLAEKKKEKDAKKGKGIFQKVKDVIKK